MSENSRENTAGASTERIDAFAYCPRCGAQELSRKGRGLLCKACGHQDFNNPITAVAVFVFDSECRALLIQRAKDPAKGKWAPPGGFLDAGETLEEAVTREVAEETGLALRDIRYLCAFPNNYVYRGLSQPVCDVFFTARAETCIVECERGELDAFRWCPPEAIMPEELAFESMRRALAILLRSPSGEPFITR
jgi:NAD+ diphosphatase